MDVPLNFNRQGGSRFKRETSEDSFAISETFEQLSGFIRRQFPIFVFITSCCLALGLVYLLTTPPTFTSHAMLLIDSSKLRVLQPQDAPVSDIPIDTAQVETQVEILKSENIGLSVVKDLKLTEDREFIGSGSGLLGWITGLFSSPKVQSETKLDRAALAAFLAKRSVTRVARTYVLDIGFTSFNPARAAEIANAVADAYIVDQLQSKYQATRRASAWLQDRIKELRQQASDADRAVLNYKEKNNIVSVGGTNDNPKLLGEQQIVELNTQLGQARAQAEEAKARLERITEVMKADLPDATVTDTLHSEVINRLRNQYLDLAGKEAIWSVRYGVNHLATVNLRTQMDELRRSINDELGRIAQGYKSDYEIAKTRVEGLEHNLEGLVANSQVINRDRLGLRDLESTAQVYQKLYDSFLQRYMEAIQQQSFPITEARVISAAAPPDHKSGPRTLPALAIAGFIGLLLSFAAAVLREAIDQVFRTARQVETALQVNCLAVLPRLGPATGSTWLGRGPAAWLGNGPSAVPEPNPVAARSDRDMDNAGLSKVSDLITSVLSREATKAASIAPRDLAGGSKKLDFENRPFLRQVVDEPLSGFAEAFRSIKIAADIDGSSRNHKVIGITSTVPGEGKSTVAANLAELIAHSGKRVILLDGDLRNPTLTRALTPDSKAGLLEVLNNQISLGDAICTDDETGLGFVPALVKSRLVHTNEVLASEALKSLIDRLRSTYDYIIVDLPPLAPVVDVRAATKIVDSYIYVIEWGQTRKNFVQQQLLAAPELHHLLLGVVLNKADIRVMGRYEEYYGGYYDKRYYGRYGYSG
ncbi:polysaccharide biosynthesis tyrosine autokinase [Bradyrhizobium sp. dw_78]|uniref:polysaccharide biosynthesis tyrosine autokinase n=1 Tax=Bradyrhizobium sp. dw_78 TaxID=2719793 RepID=UPI001BD3CA90|nr:polysaccharide biosynthesis tyrosine autokinase [Bradyrhizobium sp. dw_78]